MYLRALIFIALLLFAVGCQEAAEPAENESLGRLAVALSGSGEVSFPEMQLTITEIAAYSATEGWVALQTATQMRDLAGMNRTFIADALVPLGSYEQVRLIFGGLRLSHGRSESNTVMPASEFAIKRDFLVSGNGTTVVEITLLANESIFTTQGGTYIFAPQTQFVVRQGAAIAQAEGLIEGGEQVTSARVGMDENGVVGIGVGIRPTEVLRIRDGTLTSGTLAPPPNLTASPAQEVIVLTVIE